MLIKYPIVSTGRNQGESAGDAATIYPSFLVKQPKSFDFSKFEEWPRCIKRFERYRVISGLSKQEGTLQVNALLYAMGDESGDIFTMQALPLMMTPSRIITITSKKSSTTIL